MYGTEIFNLLEPLLNYLIEKLNPEFNFEKLRQLHSQNVSLTCSLPLVGACEHVKDCIECHNLLQCAMTKCNAKKEEKSVQTTNSNSSLSDTPLRKIEAGLYDITKEIISLGIPMDDSELANNKPILAPCPEMKHIACQTESSSHSSRRHDAHSSHSSRHRHGDSRKHSSVESSRHKSKESKSSSESRKRTEESKRSSADKHSKESRSRHRSSKSTSESHKKKSREKSRSADDSSDEEREKQPKRRRSSSVHEPKVQKRVSDDKDSVVESKKPKGESSSKAHSDVRNKKLENVVILETSSDESDKNDKSDDSGKCD